MILGLCIEYVICAILMEIGGTMIRYEVYIPINDKLSAKEAKNQSVKISLTATEIFRQTGGFTSNRPESRTQGLWRNPDGSGVYKDDCIVIKADSDIDQSQFFTKQPEVWKKRFNQKELYIISYKIDLI